MYACMYTCMHVSMYKQIKKRWSDNEASCVLLSLVVYAALCTECHVCLYGGSLAWTRTVKPMTITAKWGVYA